MLSNSVTLSRREMDEMRRRAANLADAGVLVVSNEADERDAAWKADRKAASAARAGTWNNTLAGMRRAKETQRKEALEAAERAREQLDREEAEKRLQARLDAITRATDLVAEKTDRMKMLKSRRLLSQVQDVGCQQRDTKRDRKRGKKK